MTNPHALMVSRGGIQRSTKGEAGVQVDPLATATLRKNVEYTYRLYSLENGPRSNMDSDSSERAMQRADKNVFPTTAIIFLQN